MISKERLNKRQVSLSRAISKFGRASRKEAAELVRAGRVKVNARIMRSPNMWVDPAVDRIVVDGRTLRPAKFEYLVMNKPVGVVTTRSDELARKTVYAFVASDDQRLFAVGRLDKDTSGLLLFTNDSRFGERVTNPLTKLPKTYHVIVNRDLLPEDRRRMETRFHLDERTELQPAKVRVSANDPRQFDITIFEGKNRQIRRLCDRLGYSVLSLCRVSIGAVKLGRLEEGQTRALTDEERTSILSYIRS